MAAADDKQLLAHILSIPGLRLAGAPAHAAPVEAPAATAEQPASKRTKRGKAGSQAAEATAAVAGDAPPQAAPALVPDVVAPMVLVQEPVTETLECPTSELARPQ